MAHGLAARASTRAGSRQSTGASSPGLTLEERTAFYVRDAVALTGLGVAGMGLTQLAGHQPLAVPALIAGISAAGTRAALGARTASRHDLHDRLVTSLAPLLGMRQLDRRTVRVSAWTRGWPGRPRRVLVRYAPGAADGEPGWASEVAGVVGARLLGSYTLGEHDRRRCRLRLTLDESEPADLVDPPAAQVRAQRAITELIGPTAKVKKVELEGGELTAMTVEHQAGAKLAAAGYRHRVERVISTMMPGRWRAVWDLEADSARFEIRPALPASVWLPAPRHADSEDLLANYRQVKIPYAVDEDGQQMFWYPAKVPHMILTGSTGSGKTSMAHSLLGEVTSYGWPVWVLDAKRVEFLDFRDWPNVQIVAGSLPDQVALIHRAWLHMEHRYELIESGRATVNDFEPLVIFLDEYTEFRANLIEWYARIKVRGEPTKPSTLTEVASLSRKARTARIHLVLSTQRPDAEFLGGEMRDNFGQRISMGRLSPQGAMMMWENPATGVSLPRSCTGRAMATHEDGRPVEVQCYRFPDVRAPEGSEQARLLAAVRPAVSRHERFVIVRPEDEDDLDTGEVIEPTFRDYAGARWALASERSELDPLAAARGDGPLDVDGRELSSTLASLGLSRPAAASTPHPRLHVVPDLEADDTLPPAQHVDEPEEERDTFAGYGPSTTCSPSSLVVGDLIEIDEDTATWGVVDEPTEEDMAAPGLTAISWRGDGDECGSLSLDDDTLIAVRRPEDT